MSQNRSLLADMTRQQRELKQIMSINEEYQLQANAFREREVQFTELSSEYKEKLEVIKITSFSIVDSFNLGPMDRMFSSAVPG